jgi:hypothetical protein
MSTSLPKPSTRFTDQRMVHIRFSAEDRDNLEIIQHYLDGQGLHKHDASRNGATRYAIKIAADLIRKQR